MSDVIQFLTQAEVWIYVLLGGVGLWYLRKLLLAWEEWRAAIFGLERENAQRHLNQAITGLVMLVLMGLVEFSVITFISPDYPGLNPLPTPTLNILATPTTTLVSPTSAPGETPSAITPIPTFTPTPNQPNGCIPGQIELTDPKPGQELAVENKLIGTVNVPDFGFYKFEFSQPGSQTWFTISAGNQPVTNGELGNWNTSQLTSGDYLLRLVVVDNKTQPFPACVVPVRIPAR